VYIIHIHIITFGGLGLKGSASARVMMFRRKGVCTITSAAGPLLALNRRFKEPAVGEVYGWLEVDGRAFSCAFYYIGTVNR
jgi:hypothetical protein